jgi:tRNA pseudouridine38-40 synthase
MNVYKMTIAYDGTLYGGWQEQINAISIQSVIQNALSIILRIPIKVIGSGRTDAGVHAQGQVAHFKYSEPLDLSRCLSSLNALLPPDIRILKIDPAPCSFHARFSALSKLYHYYLHLDAAIDPFQRLYTHRPLHPVAIDQLKETAELFVGTHDFTSFANTRSSLSKNGNVRTIHRLEITEREKGVCLAFEGNGFLYKMVRNIVGALLDVCAGRMNSGDIERIFAAKDRRAAGVAAPALGLFLMEVRYPLQMKQNDARPSHSRQPHDRDEEDR